MAIFELCLTETSIGFILRLLVSSPYRQTEVAAKYCDKENHINNKWSYYVQKL